MHRVVVPIVFMLVAGCGNKDSTISIGPSEPVINEFMIRNQITGATQLILDEDNRAADWVEIYNPSSEFKRLKGYYLSDNAAQTKKYAFPDITLSPGGFYLVWGGNSAVSPANHLGFSFSASSSEREEILLFKGDGGDIVDRFDYNAVSDAAVVNSSYGRTMDGGTTWKLFENPSPGKSNGSRVTAAP